MAKHTNLHSITRTLIPVVYSLLLLFFSNYEYSEFAGNTRSYGIEGLEEGTIYYFAVTTEDVSGNESTYSDEVYCTISVSDENQSPRAVFNTDIQAGTVPLVVNFDASGSHDADGGIVQYSWQFGDGETEEGIYVSHTNRDNILLN
jgi:PKD repeat protein